MNYFCYIELLFGNPHDGETSTARKLLLSFPTISK